MEDFLEKSEESNHLPIPLGLEVKHESRVERAHILKLKRLGFESLVLYEIGSRAPFGVVQQQSLVINFSETIEGLLETESNLLGIEWLPRENIEIRDLVGTEERDHPRPHKRKITHIRGKGMHPKVGHYRA